MRVRLEAEVEKILLGYDLDADSPKYRDQIREVSKAIVDEVLIALAAELVRRRT